MIRKSLLVVALIAAMLPTFLAVPADATVTRVSLVEEFGFFT